MTLTLSDTALEPASSSCQVPSAIFSSLRARPRAERYRKNEGRREKGFEGERRCGEKDEETQSRSIQQIRQLHQP